jgi:hypothetical protein
MSTETRCAACGQEVDDHALTVNAAGVVAAGAYYGPNEFAICAERNQPAPAPGRTAELAKAALLRLMEDISEDCWCAGWMSGLEGQLWQAVTDPESYYAKHGGIKPHIPGLRQLAEEAGGWWMWDDNDADGRVFVPLEAWKERFAADPDISKSKLYAINPRTGESKIIAMG